jgi:hypothetical protein
MNAQEIDNLFTIIERTLQRCTSDIELALANLSKIQKIMETENPDSIFRFSEEQEKILKKYDDLLGNVYLKIREIRSFDLPF